jgi:mannose-6-phosphate isomerase-like protein (cupin superfamily)
VSHETKAVPKVWGEEQWIVNRDYCGKLLLLRKGYRCSLHCHRVKDETFYVLSGSMRIEVGTDPEKLVVRVLGPRESVHLPPGTWHRFTGLTDTEFMEFSTHHEDDDTVRLNSSEKVPEDE